MVKREGPEGRWVPEIVQVVLREIWGGNRSPRMSWIVRKALRETKLSVRSWEQGWG